MPGGEASESTTKLLGKALGDNRPCERGPPGVAGFWFRDGDCKSTAGLVRCCKDPEEATCQDPGGAPLRAGDVKSMTSGLNPTPAPPPTPLLEGALRPGDVRSSTRLPDTVDVCLPVELRSSAIDEGCWHFMALRSNAAGISSRDADIVRGLEPPR